MTACLSGVHAGNIDYYWCFVNRHILDSLLFWVAEFPDTLYEPPGADAPVPYKKKGVAAEERRRRSGGQLASQTTAEVQYEA